MVANFFVRVNKFRGQRQHVGARFHFDALLAPKIWANIFVVKVRSKNLKNVSWFQFLYASYALPPLCSRGCNDEI